MSFFAIIIKIIPYLWPFIKEMLIGKKTWKQAFRENRGKTILTVSLAVSVVFNVVLMAKVGTLAFKHLALTRTHQELEVKYKALQSTKTVVAEAKPAPARRAEPVVEVPKVTKPAKVNKSPRSTRKVTQEEALAAELRADMERIRQRELSNEH